MVGLGDGLIVVNLARHSLELLPNFCLSHERVVDILGLPDTNASSRKHPSLFTDQFDQLD